jgi:hypothetical protein
MNKGAEHADKVVLVKARQAADVDVKVSFFALAGKGETGCQFCQFSAGYELDSMALLN